MQQAASLQAAFRDAIAAVSGIASVEQGQVSVAALPSLAARLLPRVLMAYRQAHPQVALKVRDTLSGPAFDLVRAGEVDFALTAADPQQADLHYVPLMSDSFLLIPRRIRWPRRAARCAGPTRPAPSTCPWCIRAACASTPNGLSCRTASASRRLSRPST